MGVHATSSVLVRLPKPASRFYAEAGMDNINHYLNPGEEISSPSVCPFVLGRERGSEDVFLESVFHGIYRG
ncbi:MAG: hypothetical protein JNL03_08455 [Prolixibacteraceae bacterium]|nr:hypothetical protein [Prolixibacteraceae bacterium]